MSVVISPKAFQGGRPQARPKRLYLSPSKLITYEMCPRQYWYQYEARLEAEADSSNLHFGTAVHTVAEQFLIANDHGKAFDPAAAFEKTWDDITSTNAISYGVRMTKDDLTHTGKMLMAAFPSAWAQSGLRPVKDPRGELVLERSLDVELGDGVILSTKLDILAHTPRGGIDIVDVKTPTQLCSELFAAAADQPTAYQIAVDAHAASLGIEQVTGVRFFEGKKAKTKAEWHWDATADRRSDEQVDEYITKVLDIATDIRNQRFPKRSLHAFNSPCTLCAYSESCLKENHAGLRKKKDRYTNVVQLP